MKLTSALVMDLVMCYEYRHTSLMNSNSNAFVTNIMNNVFLESNFSYVYY